LHAANDRNGKQINLPQAIQMALDSNLTIRSSAYNVDLQRALNGASVDIGKTSVEGQFGQFNSYSNDNGFTVSQSFAFPTVYVNQHKLAVAKVKSSEWQLKGSQLEIATQVKHIYGQLTYLYSKKKLLNYQDSLYSGFLRAAQLRAKTGETNQLEMITARSQAMEVRNQLQQVLSDITIFGKKLQTLINSKMAVLPADTALKRIEFVPAQDSLTVTQNPMLKLIRQEVEVSHREKKVEQSRLLPDFTVGYFSQTIQGTQDVNGIPRTFGNNYRFNGIQAGISIPLWVAPYASKIKAAGINENIARTNADNFHKSLTNNYEELLEEFRKNYATIDYYEKQALPEAQLIIEQSSRSYKAGEMNYQDFVLSLGRALTIKQNYLDALNNYNQTIIQIENISGKIF